jgi:hypothetical protein
MRRILLLSALALLAALPAEAQKRGDRNTINRVDIDEAGNAVTNADDAVRRLKPQWLRGPMGRTSSAGADGRFGEGASEAILYIDEKRQPNLDQLRTVPAAMIEEIKFMDQMRAIQMLGPGHELGAILVKTRKQK